MRSTLYSIKSRFSNKASQIPAHILEIFDRSVLIRLQVRKIAQCGYVNICDDDNLINVLIEPKAMKDASSNHSPYRHQSPPNDRRLDTSSHSTLICSGTASVTAIEAKQIPCILPRGKSFKNPNRYRQ